jgi:hypothetical protein
MIVAMKWFPADVLSLRICAVCASSPGRTRIPLRYIRATVSAKEGGFSNPRVTVRERTLLKRSCPSCLRGERSFIEKPGKIQKNGERHNAPFPVWL